MRSIKDLGIWLIKSWVKFSPVFLFIKKKGKKLPFLQLPYVDVPGYLTSLKFYQIQFSTVLYFNLKNAIPNQNNLMPRTKWERWFINKLWCLLWPFILHCPLYPIHHKVLSVLSFPSYLKSPSFPYFHGYQIVQPSGPHIQLSLLIPLFIGNLAWTNPSAKNSLCICSLVLTVIFYDRSCYPYFRWQI